MTLRQRGVHLLYRLHDLWILLAWSAILAAIMLNTFYNRSCFDFVQARDATATCQSGLDIGLMALAAIGAGMAFNDERVGYVGFLPAHVAATVIFIGVLILPAITGLTDSVFLGGILTNAFILAFKSQIPFPIFFSLLGGILGVFLGGKIKDRLIEDE